MRVNLEKVKEKRQLESILLVCVLVAASAMILIPLTAPKAEGVTHLASTLLEDGDPVYDMDGIVNGIVLWDNFDDHFIDTNYLVEPTMTLDIPNLNYQFGDPAENVIELGGNVKIDVYGTLKTHSGPALTQWTCFTGGGSEGWDGIYFHPGSSGNILDVRINNSQNGIVWLTGSILLNPGIDGSRFENIKDFGMIMDGVTGVTKIAHTNFYTRVVDPPTDTGIGLDVARGQLNIIDSSFHSHEAGLSSLNITDAFVKADNVQFEGFNQPGYSVFIKGDGSNGSVFNNCDFSQGVANNHYIRDDEASILVNNCTFDTTGGQLSVIANDGSSYPAEVFLRNPNPPGITFDNTTINVTGGSSVALQWYKDVYVEDSDTNPIRNALVRIKDRLGNPAIAPVNSTNITGWTRGFIVTELIEYSASITNFNPFNISAENNSRFGYAIPEEIMNRSKINTIIVPLNPVVNVPPIVSFIALVPPGVQSGLVTVQFRLIDPDPLDDGNMSITVEFWDPTDSKWITALLDPSSDTDNLNNDTLYTIIWISNDVTQLPDFYGTGVDIRITAYDKYGIGGNATTGPFTLDNEAPMFMAGPTVEVTETEAFVNWTTDENAEAQVFYGFTLTSPVLDKEVTGSSGSTSNSVQLTGLQPGRNYTFIVNSTDPQGNKRSSTPPYPTFKTEIRVQLVTGWNMIALPPSMTGMDVADILSSIAGQYDAVQVYDSLDPADPWKHYNPNKPSRLNDLTMLDEVHGFWILMKNNALLIPGHDDPTTFGVNNTDVPLEAGWNFVAYPSVTNRPIGPALTGVTYDIVWAFDGGTWKYYDGASGTLTQVELGMGYWIHCPAPGMWTVDFA
jgi:hypothetical protein